VLHACARTFTSIMHVQQGSAGGSVRSMQPNHYALSFLALVTLAVFCFSCLDRGRISLVRRLQDRVGSPVLNISAFQHTAAFARGPQQSQTDGSFFEVQESSQNAEFRPEVQETLGPKDKSFQVLSVESIDPANVGMDGEAFKESTYNLTFFDALAIKERFFAGIPGQRH